MRKSKKYLYSILTVNTNNYEILKEVKNPNPKVEYVCVTDNKDLTSDTWKIIYKPDIWFLYVKHHQYEFISTDVCLWLDGSYCINDDPTNDFVLPFINSDKEMMISLHNCRNNMFDELCQWWLTRDVPIENIKKLADLLNENNCSGEEFVVQTSVMLTKNTDNIKNIFQNICGAEELCSVVAPYRDDQVITSLVLTKLYKNWNKLVLMDFEYTSYNKYFYMCYHTTDKPLGSVVSHFTRYWGEDHHLYKIGNSFD